ncbi:MAG TPA: hypothetical protein VIR81_01035 [Myxococcales bacterium]|nr:hypothetical protein [Myxococcales bacterium]
MRLFAGALVTVAVGWGVVLASPTPVRHADRMHARAEHACRARGPTCRLLVKAGAPRNPGAACVCD